jgi:hypothetical protein
MSQLISEITPKASKYYTCDACLFLFDGNDYKSVLGMKLTISEKRAIIRAKNNNYRINKGDIYIRQCVKNDGIYTFKAIPEIHEICIKHDIYSE